MSISNEEIMNLKKIVVVLEKNSWYDSTVEYYPLGIYHFGRRLTPYEC